MTNINAAPAGGGHQFHENELMQGRLMNHHHRKILHSLFDHPVSANIAFKDVERMLGDLGAAIESKSGARTSVTLNGHTAFFHTAHHSIPKEEVVSIRNFLKTCGVDPENYPV